LVTAYNKSEASLREIQGRLRENLGKIRVRSGNPLPAHSPAGLLLYLAPGVALDHRFQPFRVFDIGFRPHGSLQGFIADHLACSFNQILEQGVLSDGQEQGLAMEQSLMLPAVYDNRTGLEQAGMGWL